MKRLGILFIGLVLGSGIMQLTYAQTVRSEAANRGVQSLWTKFFILPS
jgi:hypothetical protein